MIESTEDPKIPSSRLSSPITVTRFRGNEDNCSGITTGHPALATVAAAFAAQGRRITALHKRICPTVPPATIRFRLAQAMTLTFQVLGDLDNTQGILALAGARSGKVSPTEAIVTLRTAIGGPAVAAALGSGAGTAVFLMVLDRAIGGDRCVVATVAGVTFAVFMAVWNGGLQFLARRRRTVRNVFFELFVAQALGVTAAAWAVLPMLDRIRWPDIAVLTGLGVIMVAGGWLRTRHHIRGRRPDELFS
jgi:hypothetical protein